MNINKKKICFSMFLRRELRDIGVKGVICFNLRANDDMKVGHL